MTFQRIFHTADRIIPSFIQWYGELKEEDVSKTFGGKKAAPFKKGGGRSQKSPRNFKGERRKGKGSKQ